MTYYYLTNSNGNAFDGSAFVKPDLHPFKLFVGNTPQNDFILMMCLSVISINFPEVKIELQKLITDNPISDLWYKL